MDKDKNFKSHYCTYFQCATYSDKVTMDKDIISHSHHCTIVDPLNKGKNLTEIGNYSSVIYPPSTLKKVGKCSTVIRGFEGLTEVGDNCYINHPGNDEYFKDYKPEMNE